MTKTCFLEGRGDLSEWRDAARRLMAAGGEPREIDWRSRSEELGLFGLERNENPSALSSISINIPMSIPAAFIRLATDVVCHSDPRRFSLLYRLLFRLKAERHLLDVKTDADVARAYQLQKSVGRDYHKMTAFVRFKEMPLSVGVDGRRRFLAWFEPDHFIVARVAPFFQQRFNDMDWIIATPHGSASWDGQTLRSSTAPAQKPDITDETDELWRTYYASIFNPARLKVKMMTREMPKKYWKNLPEAELIPGLIAGAESRLIDMERRQATEPPLFHHRLQDATGSMPETPVAEAGTIDALREEARRCTRCELYCRATQTVFGEGPIDAKIMIVGEQPGDHEDIAGRPFVGPAGRVFDDALSLAGFDKKTLYVTNAVKHFKYELKGKRRIHQRPNASEVEHCRWWLKREIELIKPKVVVAMGATALFSLTDRRDRLGDVRGLPFVLDEGRTLFATVHPSYLLRIPDQVRLEEELARFREDIAQMGQYLP